MRAVFALCALSSSGLLAACDLGGIHDLTPDRPVLATLHGRIEGALPAWSHPRVGLLYAESPVYSPYCHEHGPTPLDPKRKLNRLAAAGCRDPFDVAPGAVGPSVALEPGQSEFQIPISQLPPAEVMVGTPESRVAYASLVVFDDANNDGELDLGRGCGRGGGGRSEPIYAASFSSLSRDQIRFVYLEGAFDTGSYFYPPPPACDSLPPPGFSIWSLGNLLDAQAHCLVSSIEEPVTLTLAEPSALDSLSCPQASRLTFERPPRGDLDGILWECTDEGALATVDTACACPELRVFSLRGCFDELNCTNADWDLRDDPPKWWPCEDPRNGLH